ncbi:MAG: DUF3871 family protein [Bacteroidetes bacterium]|nr:DUF3871 family protein [Bacteroidota bacterium]
MDTLQLVPVKFEQIESIDNLVSTSKPFIEANTIHATLDEIRNKHTIPVFARTNERLISIAEFIEVCNEVVHDIFRDHLILPPSIRLSHPIRARIAEAKDKAVHELKENEITLHYERAAFIIEIPEIKSTIEGSPLSLTVGGIKGFNLDNLNGRKGVTDEHFSFFIGFQNKLCCNLQTWSDGYTGNVGVRSLSQLKALMYNLFQNYNSSHHLHHLRRLAELELSETQFALLVGKCRLLPYLPSDAKNKIRPLLFNDTQINSIVKEFYRDENFGCNINQRINLWRLLQLFTGSNKSSYIDSFLDRSVNAYNFVEQIRFELENPGHSWFLN